LHYRLQVRFLRRWVFREFKVFFSNTMTMWQHEDIFWDSLCHDFTLWESFLFSVWSFSILCLKVCDLVKLVVGHLLTQSLKQFEVVPPIPNSHTFDNLSFQFANCNLQTKMSLASKVLFPPLNNLKTTRDLGKFQVRKSSKQRLK
jgi:hypothetical protein